MSTLGEAWLLVLAQIGSVGFLVLFVMAAGGIVAEARWWVRDSLRKVLSLAAFGSFALWVSLSLWDFWTGI